MDERLLQRIRQCESLPSLPAVAVQVLQLVRNPNCQIPQLARVISKDPALASKILRTVNSSFYSRPRKVSRLTQALAMLGLQTVRVLALGFSLAHNLKNYKNKGFRALEYWRRSIYSATAALTLAQRMHLAMLEEAFIAALLMDMGILALHAMSSEEYDSISDRARTHADLLKLEEATFKGNHAEVGGVLADMWGLPDALAVPIAHHHSPAEVTDENLRQLAEVCQMAGRCADVFVEQSAAGAIEELRAFCQVHLAMDDTACDELIQQILRRTGEIAPLFEVHLNTDVSFEEILQRANESVVRLTLESQRSSEPTGRPDEVKATAVLHDRGYFEEALQRTTKESQGSFAVVLVTIDRLAELKREHGEKLSDAVIARLSEKFGGLAQQPNVLAQYLADQFAVLMIETDRHQALMRAETFRREIFNTPIDFGRVTIPVTVSIGIAAADAGTPFKGARQLVTAAELAVDAARQAGHNCVRAFSLSQPPADHSTAA